nr:hypothetical protein [Paenibacillus larvae]
MANRTVEKAEQLASFLSPYTKTKGMGLSEIGNLMDNVHLIVNTTSAGMAPNEDEVPYTLTAVPPGFVASDLIYNPMKTAFLKQASKLGAIVHSGLGMFIYQGLTPLSIGPAKSSGSSNERSGTSIIKTELRNLD